MEKIQLLAKKFNYVPVQDLCIPKNYPVSDQFSFTTVECSQVKDIVNSIPNSPRNLKLNDTYLEVEVP